MKQKRKQRLIRFSLMNRKTKTGWAIGVQVLFRRIGALDEESCKKDTRSALPASTVKGFRKPILSRMTIREKIYLGRRVYVHIADNPDFTFINPRPAMLLLVVEELNEANENFVQSESKLKWQILREKEKMFDEVFCDILSFVDEVAKGEEDVYRSAGIVGKKL